MVVAIVVAVAAILVYYSRLDVWHETLALVVAVVVVVVFLFVAIVEVIHVSCFYTTENQI